MVQCAHQRCFEAIIAMVHIAAESDQAARDLDETVARLVHGSIAYQMQEIFTVCSRRGVHMDT